MSNLHFLGAASGVCVCCCSPFADLACGSVVHLAAGCAGERKPSYHGSMAFVSSERSHCCQSPLGWLHVVPTCTAQTCFPLLEEQLFSAFMGNRWNVWNATQKGICILLSNSEAVVSFSPP